MPKALIVGITTLILIAFIVVFKNPFENYSPTKQTSQQNTFSIFPPKASDDEPPLLLKSIGVNLDDIVFSKAYLTGFEMPFMGFGYVIPAKFSSTGKNKANPQPTFILPLGTKVLSIVDGVVVNIPTLWSKDYSILVSADGQYGKWMYETEHIINPKVKKGDKVKAGQVIAEVSDFNKNIPGFGIVEIGILKGGSPPQHICPFAYLDPSIKEETFTKIKALYKSWEEYIGNTALYNEDEPVTGCVSMNPIEG
ncbi:M23 family metallopeptidase [Candidatus Daviesbacteria bacterium]|nr:M23 family metallopeptidase [Candidatus Daviesbacteria bacterium]